MKKGKLERFSWWLLGKAKNKVERIEIKLEKQKVRLVELEEQLVDIYKEDGDK